MSNIKHRFLRHSIRQRGRRKSHQPRNLWIELFEQRLLLAGDINIVKSTNGNFDPPFSFMGSGPAGSNFGNFILDTDFDSAAHASVADFNGLPTGTYTITEAAAPGFSLTRLTCTDPDGGSSIDVGNRTVTIDLDDGEKITCIFFNTEDQGPQDSLVIDDFNTPQGPLNLLLSGHLDSTVVGEMLGGTRFMDVFFESSSPGSSVGAAIESGSYNVGFNNAPGSLGAPGSFGATGVIYEAPTGEPFDFSPFDRFDLSFVTPSEPSAEGAIDMSIFGLDTNFGSDSVRRSLTSNSGEISIPFTDFLNFDLSKISQIGIAFSSSEPGINNIAVESFSASGGESTSPVDTKFPFLAEVDLTADDVLLPIGPNHSFVNSQITVKGTGSGFVDTVQDSTLLKKGDAVDFNAVADFFYDVTFLDVDPVNDFGEGLGASFTIPNLSSTLSATHAGVVDTTRPNLGLLPQIDLFEWDRDTIFELPDGHTTFIPTSQLHTTFTSQLQFEFETEVFSDGFESGDVSAWSMSTAERASTDTGPGTGEPGDHLPSFNVATTGQVILTEIQVGQVDPMLMGPPSRIVRENTTVAFNDITVMERFNPNRLIRAAVSPFNQTNQTFFGTITLGNTNGLTFLDGDGIADQNVFFEGTVHDVNAALSGLQVHLGPRQEGDNILNVVISDGADTFVNFIEVDLNVRQEVPLAANVDLAELDEDSGPVTIDVFANDQVFTPPNTTPTISLVNGSSTNTGQTISISSGARLTNNGDTLTYEPAANFSGNDTFTYAITNGLGDESTALVRITVNPINDGPINSVPGPQTIDEDNDLIFGANSLTITDADGDVNVFVGLQSASGNISVPVTAGVTVTDTGSGNLTIQGTVGNVNNALNGLRYAPNADFDGSDALQIVTFDLGNFGAGGPSVDTDLINITINPVNDGPVNTVPGPQTLFNTDTLSFTTGDFSIQDVDASTLEVKLEVGQGIVSLGSTTGLQLEGNHTNSLTATGSLADINNGLGNLLYDPLDSFLGVDTLTMTTNDGALSDTDTVSISVAPPVVPFAASDFFEVDEDPTIPLSFTLEQLLSNDIAPGPGDTTVQLTRVNQLPLSTGTFPSPNGTLSFDSTGGTFTYTPAPDFFGLDTFTYTIESNPLVGDGPSEGTVNINVQPINDAPILVVPGKQSFFTDFDNRFSETFHVDDIDAGSDDIEVELTIGDGTLTIGGTAGVIVTPNPDGRNGIRIRGSISSINNALNSGVDYTTTLSGSKKLGVVVNDLGNTGGIDQQTTSATVEVEVRDLVLGDADGDGVVRFADFLILANNFGKMDAVFQDGDFNFDGKVDFADFLILSNRFGEDQPSPALRVSMNRVDVVESFFAQDDDQCEGERGTRGL